MWALNLSFYHPDSVDLLSGLWSKAQDVRAVTVIYSWVLHISNPHDATW